MKDYSKNRAVIIASGIFMILAAPIMGPIKMALTGLGLIIVNKPAADMKCLSDAVEEASSKTNR